MASGTLMTSLLAVPVALILALSTGASPASPALGPSGSQTAAGELERGKRCMPAKRIARAKRYADRRSGRVSFAFADECRRLLGDHRFRRHSSASVVKLMLLVAYLRQGGLADRALTGAEKVTLGPMIKSSDNDAANRIYATVGDAGLNELARDARMRSFSPSPVWGGSQITAGDQASFIRRIERFVPRRHEDYVLDLTSRIVPSQRWGIPEAAPSAWRISFKGGWFPAADGWRVNQVGLLRRSGRRISLAVLTDGAPSFEYGQETIRRVSQILFEGYRR